jgi:hypothetical protein
MFTARTEWRIQEEESNLFHTLNLLNQPQSKRFAQLKNAGYSRQRLECGGFSAAFVYGN